MARNNRQHLPGYIWHITHRCHNREHLFKFGKDKDRFKYWLFKAKKLYGLCILNYTITSNHIHLLLYDGKKNIIPKSIQLIAGRVGREYNRRKKRKGAFWEGRYHATAVDTGVHLIGCLVYIDLNMVRAGVVNHPSEWKFGGYREIQSPKQRYGIVDRERLAKLLRLENTEQLAAYHEQWVEALLRSDTLQRDQKWTEEIAVGSKAFIVETMSKLGIKTRTCKNSHIPMNIDPSSTNPPIVPSWFSQK